MSCDLEVTTNEIARCWGKYSSYITTRNVSCLIILRHVAPLHKITVLDGVGGGGGGGVGWVDLLTGDWIISEGN